MGSQLSIVCAVADPGGGGGGGGGGGVVSNPDLIPTAADGLHHRYVEVKPNLST